MIRQELDALENVHKKWMLPMTSLAKNENFTFSLAVSFASAFTLWHIWATASKRMTNVSWLHSFPCRAGRDLVADTRKHQI